MKKSNSLFSKFTKFSLAACALMLTSQAATAADEFLVYLKTETQTRNTYMLGDRHIEKTEQTSYIVWNVRTDEFREIYLDLDERTYSAGRDRKWSWSEVIVDQDTNNKYSTLSIFGSTGDDDNPSNPSYFDSLAGVMVWREIENGPDPRKLEVAKYYSGDGMSEFADLDQRLRRWVVKKYSMKFTPHSTKLVNDARPGKVSDAQGIVIRFLEDSGYREAGN